MISVDEIRQRVLDIDDRSDDSEAAHRAEDRLYRDVLRAVAAGAPNAAELAKAALEANELLFDRHYSFADD